MVRIPSVDVMKSLCDCESCGLYKEAGEHPYIPGRWANSDNHPEYPSMILVGEAPGRHEAIEGYCFAHTSGRNIQKALGDEFNNVYLTNICRCVPWADLITKDKVRKPSPQEMTSCLPWIKLEISKFPEGTLVVPMGSTAISTLFPDCKETITKIAGRVMELDIHGKKYPCIPNVHPASIGYNPSLSTKFYSTFNMCLEYINKSVQTNHENDLWEMLDPSKAIFKLNEALQLYKDGVIKYVVTDTETDGLIPYKDNVIMFGLSHTADIKGYSIPLFIQNRVDHQDFPVKIDPCDIKVSDNDIAKIKAASRNLFNQVPIVGHNIKFDLKMMAYHNFLDLNKVKVYNDTMFMSAIIVGRTWAGDSIGLKEMCTKIFDLSEGWDWIIDEYIGRYNRVVDRHFGNIPTSILGKYCAFDHYYTRQLHEYLYPKIKENDCGDILNALNTVTVAYSESELKGIEINWDMYDLIKNKSTEYLNNIVHDIKKDPMIKKMMLEKYKLDLEENSKKKRPKDEEIFKTALYNGDYFSLGSVKDKRELIYKRYNVPVTALTDKGQPSTDKDTITNIMNNTQNSFVKNICSGLLEYNKFSKIKSTYVDNIRSACDEESNRYHVEFNLVGTVTGRMASGFHTLPKASSVKYMYTSRDYKNTGSIWISPDMSQLELRTIAGIANETSWIEAYKNDADLHQLTASKMFNVPFEEVTKKQRTIGKTQNFAVAYGSGAKSQSTRLGISVEEAQEMLDKYYSTIPNVIALKERQERFAIQNGYIWNMFHRYMPIPDAQSTDMGIQGHGKRAAFNYLIQSTASDIVTRSFARMYTEMKKRGMKSMVYGTVHDSIETSAADFELITMFNLFKYHFEEENNNGSLPWMNGCPFRIDIEFGTSWGGSVEMKPDELDNDHVKFKSSGLECNVMDLKNQLVKCYDVDYKELDRIEMSDKDFGSEDFVRDSHKVKFEMIISNKEGF